MGQRFRWIASNYVHFADTWAEAAMDFRLVVCVDSPIGVPEGAAPSPLMGEGWGEGETRYGDQRSHLPGGRPCGRLPSLLSLPQGERGLAPPAPAGRGLGGGGRSGRKP
jgi:hypothetical protein